MATNEVKEVQDVGDATFQADVLQSDKPVLVDFWAPWCGPCRMVAPIVKELAGEYDGKVEFRKLNTDENPQVATTFGIRSIPTLMLFKGGQRVDQIVGFRPKAAIKERIEAALA
ncbi:MAG TPA: thioredoxin [Dehalococcoidia bacterium]|nr:thioredoxin [Dehalococcoidia bacterium]